MPKPSLSVENHGSVVLVRPLDVSARAWLAEHCLIESWQWFGGALACEPRFVADVVRGAIAGGLRVTS